MSGSRAVRSRLVTDALAIVASTAPVFRGTPSFTGLGDRGAARSRPKRTSRPITIHPVPVQF